MRFIEPETYWPESWILSQRFDREEVSIGAHSRRTGYATSYRLRRDIALRSVADFVIPGSSILDVAAAQGNFSLQLAEAGYAVTWNDIREDLVDYVKLKHTCGTIRYVPGNIYELDLPPKSFDAVLMTEVIEHVAHPDQFLKTVAALVRPGGHVVMTTPNGEYFRSRLPRFSDYDDTSQFEAREFMPDADGHIFLLHEDEVRRLASAAGLRVERFLFFSNPLSQGHIKTAAVLARIPLKLTQLLESFTQTSSDGVKKRLNAQILTVMVRDDSPAPNLICDS